MKLIYVLLSTTKNFAVLINTCHKFRSYWSYSGTQTHTKKRKIVLFYT